MRSAAFERMQGGEGAGRGLSDLSQNTTFLLEKREEKKRKKKVGPRAKKPGQRGGRRRKEGRGSSTIV